MSSANMPTRGETTTPQLSKRALTALKKGAMVELWVECEPFTLQDGDIQRVEKQEICCTIYTALIQHFSKKVKRDLAGRLSKRVHIPFFRTPVKLLVDWMKNGGTGQLGTAANPYPKAIEHLKILKDLVVYLEVDQLGERIAKDIQAMTPILPPPKKNIVPRKKPIQEERHCYYCGKPGHLKRNCRDWMDRDAVFVTKSNAETYALNGAVQSVNSNGPKSSKVEPAAEKKVAVEATSLAVKPDVPINRKLRPVSGKINAFDEAGMRWAIHWSMVEIEVVGPVTISVCKITGTATAW